MSPLTLEVGHEEEGGGREGVTERDKETERQKQRVCSWGLCERD